MMTTSAKEQITSIQSMIAGKMTIGFAFIMDWRYNQYTPYDFLRACGYGNLGLAKKILSAGRININLKLACKPTPFVNACTGGHLSVARWLHSIDNDIIDGDNGIEAFAMACTYGHLSVIKWLYRIDSSVVGNNGNKLFINACRDRRLAIAQWLHKIGVTADRVAAFTEACSNGYLDVAQWLHKIDNDIDRVDAFIGACSNGHLDVAQWIHKIDNGIIADKRNAGSAFHRACLHGHSPVVQWLYSINSKIAGKNSANAFRAACTGGHLNVAMWLHSVNAPCSSPSNRECSSSSFTWTAYRNGHLSVVQWLHSVGHRIGNEFFEAVCKPDNKYNDIRDWVFMSNDKPRGTGIVDALPANYLAARELYRRKHARNDPTEKSFAELRDRVRKLEKQLAKKPWLGSRIVKMMRR